VHLTQSERANESTLPHGGGGLLTLAGDALRRPSPQSVTARERAAPLGRLLERAADRVGPVGLQRSMIRLLFRTAGLVEATLTLPSGRVHVWTSRPRPGDARAPLLLLHGFGADAEVQWASQVRALARRHRLVIPDLFYFGGSRPHTPSFHLDDQLGMVLELMDRLRLERFDVVGISFGGFVAFELAARFGERVGRVVISNSPGHVLSHEDHEAMLARLGVGEVSDLLVPSRASIVRDLIGIAFHRPPRLPEVAVRDAFRHFFRHDADERRKVMRRLTARIEEPGLETRRIARETLVLWGEHDRVFPATIGRRLAAAIGEHARLHVIPGTAHAPNQEKPREYNRVLLEFLNERRAPAAPFAPSALRRAG
jgi:pimeloyl-ACP methyl ester carboxylesterase